MPKKFDPDERFTLHPHEGEEVIRKVLDTPKGEPKPCPECGAVMVYEVERDEKPDGTILGYGVWLCRACGYTDDA